MATATVTTSRTLAGIPTTTTSAFTPVITTPVTSPTSTNGNNGGNGFNNGGSGGTLYLFTFLTTLLLLLAVSCGIVVRSFILRRRFHRRVEEAIAAGVLLPGQTGDIGMGPGGTLNVFRRHVGEKPKMWEVWIDERSYGDKPTSVSSEWSKIQPVAATQISEVPPKAKFELVEEAPPAPLPPAPVYSRITGLFSRRAHGRDSSATNATPAAPEAPSPAPGQRTPRESQLVKDDKTRSSADINSSVHVAVLIAMPDPSRPRYNPGASPVDDNGGDGDVKGKQRSPELISAVTEEHELPQICIGLTQAQISNNAPPTASVMEQMSNVLKA